MFPIDIAIYISLRVQISQIRLPAHLQTPKVDWQIVQQAYDQFVEELHEEKPEAVVLDLDTIFNGEEDDTAPIDKINAYAERLGSTLATSKQGHAFFNGKHMDVNEVCQICFTLSMPIMNPFV